MKKVISLVLALVLCAALFCGCNKGGDIKAIVEAGIKSPADLAGCKVAVQTATTSYDILKELVDGGTKIEIKDYDKVTACFSELQLDRVDAVLVDSVVAAYYIIGPDSNKYKIAWESTEGEPMGICLNKNSTELAELIEAAIDTLYYNGTIADIAKKHFGNDFTAGLRTVTEAPVIDQAKAQALTGGTLKVGTEIGYPPMEYLGDNNEFVGFDIDVAKEIGKILGVNVEFVDTAWDGIFASLDKGLFDCIISAVSITEDRQAKYILTDPYVTNRQQIIVKN